MTTIAAPPTEAPRRGRTMSTTPPPRVLTVRRPLVRPAGDPRRLIDLMRRWVLRRAVGLGVIVLALAMFQVWLRLQAQQLAYEIAAARQMEKRLLHERRELDIELEMLRAKTHLVDEASRRLGLGDAKRGQVVDLP